MHYPTVPSISARVCSLDTAMRKVVVDTFRTHAFVALVVIQPYCTTGMLVPLIRALFKTATCGKILVQQFKAF